MVTCPDPHVEIWLPQYLQEGQHRRAQKIQEVSVGHCWWLSVELTWGRTILDVLLTTKKDWLGMLGWPWDRGLQKHERVEQSKTRDLRSGLQDGRRRPVQRSLWKNPMEYGHEEKGGPQELADSQAPERSIPTYKWSKHGKRPAWMTEELLTKFRQTPRVFKRWKKW